MHSNILTLAICVLAIPASVTARPNVYSISERSIEPVARYAHPISVRRRNQRAQLQQAAECATAPAAEAGEGAVAGEKQKGAAAGNKQKEAAAGEQQKEAAAGEKQKEAAAGEKEKEAAAGEKEGAAGEEAAGGEEEAKENEVEIESAFDTAVPVEGGELKQDLVFTPSTVGKFEFEFQSAAADEITVTENAGGAAAAPPTGFEAIEPNSYTVALSVSKGAGLTLSKIDYIFDAALVEGKDVTQAKVGKLCAETGSFVISETLGELEFELEENEVTLNLNKDVTAEGQWGIFLPVAAAAAGNATGEAGADAGAKEKAAAEKEKAAAEKEKATAEKEKKQQEKAAADAAKKEKAATEAAMKEKAASEAAMEKKAATEAAAQHEMAQQQKSALAALLAAAEREQAAAAARVMA